MSEEKKIQQTELAMPKSLTMEKIEQTAKESNKMEQYDLSDEDLIMFYPIFPNRKINELLEELREDLIYAEEKKIELDSSDDFFLNYVYFLCIKHFTSLKEGFSDNLEDKILQLEHLSDTEYFNQIVSEVFMVSELDKVIDSLSQIFAIDKVLEKINEKTQEHMGRLEFRHKELLEELDQTVESGVIH